MFSPWQMQPGYPQSGYQLPLLPFPTGAFPVPEALHPDELPPAVKASMLRPIEGPPKPAVTLPVMNATQASMIAPDLPYRSNV